MCTNVTQPLDLGIIKCFKQLYGRHQVQKALCLMYSGKDIELKISALKVIYFTVVSCRQVTHSTVVNGLVSTATGVNSTWKLTWTSVLKKRMLPSMRTGFD